MAGDSRVQQYARLLVERSLGVQPRWQVVVSAGVEARPLVEEVERQVARHGAWPILQAAGTTLRDRELYVNGRLVQRDGAWLAAAAHA